VCKTGAHFPENGCAIAAAIQNYSNRTENNERQRGAKKNQTCIVEEMSRTGMPVFQLQLSRLRWVIDTMDRRVNKLLYNLLAHHEVDELGEDYLRGDRR